MNDALKQKILERAAFNEHDSYYRLGYDSEKEPHVKEMIIAARAENARLLPVVTELLELVERQQATLNDMAKAEVKSNLEMAFKGMKTYAQRSLADTEATLSRLAEPNG